MPCAMILVQVACIALAGLLPLAARAERPSQMSQLLQGHGQVVEVAAHGHFVEKSKKDGRARETCWGNFDEGTKVTDEGADCGHTRGVNVAGCKQYCGGRNCKSFTWTRKWGGMCYCKSQTVTCKSATTHDENGFTTFYTKPCGGTNPGNNGGEEQTPTPAPGPPPVSGEVDFKFTVAKFKPDIECRRHDDAKGRATARLGKFGNEGIGIIGLIEFEWQVQSPPPGYWYVGAQCRNPAQPFSDPVIILFKDSEFDFVGGIGQSAKLEWSQLPYVGDGSYQSAMNSGIEGYQDATSCTATNTNAAIGVRGFAGALVKHKQSGQEVCVVVGTYPHSRYHIKADQYNDAISNAGCKGKAMVFMMDQNSNSPHWEFDSKKEWGWGHDPGKDVPCDPSKRVGCTCCLQEGMEPNTKNLKYDRIAAFGPMDWGKQAVRVENFYIQQDWVCNTKGEHRITTGTVVVKHR